jgi:hypothetical protein
MRIGFSGNAASAEWQEISVTLMPVTTLRREQYLDMRLWPPAENGLKWGPNKTAAHV